MKIWKKEWFEKNFGEGTAGALDYGKLLIIGLCIYIAVMVSGCMYTGAK